MALFGSILGALKGAGSFLGQVTGALGAVRALGAPSPISFVPAAGPVVAMAGQQPALEGLMRGGLMGPARGIPGVAGGIITAGGKALTRLVAPILVKIAEATGSTTMTLRRAVKIVRRMGRVIGPAGVAVALGLTIQELGTLILADSQRQRRRMNPANVTALRRCMRRLQSFHRLCQKADLLSRPSRARRKSKPGFGGDGTRILQVK